MADPFSTLAATIGLLDVCVKVVTYLVDIKESAKSIEHDINVMKEEIDSLIHVNDLIKSLEENIQEAGLILQSAAPFELERLWQSIKDNTESCAKVVGRLEKQVRDIVGKHEQAKPTSKMDGIMKTVRKQSKDPGLAKIHQSLSMYHQELQLSLTGLDIFYTRMSVKATDNVSNKMDKLHEKESRFAYQLQLIRAMGKANSFEHANLHATIASAALAVTKPINRHFIPPCSVCSIYTGRERLLDDLHEVLDNQSSFDDPNAQKRFVIQGLGGSGKTQFCWKFAQVNRQKQVILA
ncbi:hypothetical protein LOCC1_G002894 [Lachnellula occidentalis]|uniref:Fungal N-terminal domain-containing protein n=1 Tax=Lachnellula occidentalis TaxID=215460 RepID=A0A8H8UGL7_9HELO|nr:hypothetical protein LOCC1_G002894 [Lachnellula occidentalis]